MEMENVNHSECTGLKALNDPTIIGNSIAIGLSSTGLPVTGDGSPAIGGQSLPIQDNIGMTHMTKNTTGTNSGPFGNEHLYFTPNIEDIHVGYIAEFKQLGGSWAPYQVIGNIGWLINGVMSGTKLLSNEIRVPFLTREQIESCGFTFIKKSIDSWFQIDKNKKFDTDLQNFHGYKAYNVFLNYGFHDKKLKIKADFFGGSDWGGAETLFEGECRCINELKQILKQIHITPFYGE